ncbi:MAG: replication-associated recombination protein A, partial [Deltaproteobacteria bacterium]
MQMDKPIEPLADRMRPKRIEDIVGQDHLLSPDSVLSRALRSGRIFSVIFWGPPGSGKTTLAKLVARYTQNPFESFSAVTSGLKELRQVISGAKRNYNLTKKPTILFVDEIHRFNK